MDWPTDPIVNRHYPNGLGPTRVPDRDAHIASYEDPWAKAFFQPYEDFQPSRSFVDPEWGAVAIVGYGYGPSAPLLGTLVIRDNADGKTYVSFILSK